MRLVIFYLFLLVATISCSVTSPLEEKKSGGGDDFINDSQTPYATIDELEIISSDANNVHHKVARVMALQEAMSEEDYEGYELSKTPVIIYGVDGIPQYYEYRLRKGNYAYKSYAISVEKHKGIGVTVKMDVANDYSSSGNMKVVAPIYPARYGLVGSISRSSALSKQYYIPDTSKNLSITELMEGTEIGNALNSPSTRSINNIELETMLIANPDDPNYWAALEKYYASTEGNSSWITEAKSNYEELKKSNKDKYNNMQAGMDEIIMLSTEEAEKILLTKKEEAKVTVITPSRGSRWYDTGHVYAHKIYRPGVTSWGNVRRMNKSGNGYCGPVATAMIMYSYIYKYIPNAYVTYDYYVDEIKDYTNNASNFNKYMFIAIDANLKNGDRAHSMVHWEFNNAFRAIGKSVQWGYGAIWWHNTAKKAYNHIASGSPLLVNIPGHWIIAYKADYQRVDRGFWFLWWWIGWKDYRVNFHMTDNGSTEKIGGGRVSWEMNEDNWRLIWMHPVDL